MSEFGGFTETLKDPACTRSELGSAALVAAVALPRYGGPNFPKGIIRCIKKIKIKKVKMYLLMWFVLGFFSVGNVSQLTAA